MLLRNVDRRFDNRFRLHNRNFGIGNRQTATSVTHHRVEFVQACDNVFDLGNRLVLCFCKRRNIFFRRGNEFVKGRIKETNGYGIATKRFEQAFEVGLLHRLDLRKRRFSFCHRVRTDHFTECADSCRIEEHMFRAAKTDTLRAECNRLFRVVGRIRVRSDAKRFIFVRKFHNTSEIAGVGICGNGLDKRVVDVTRRTVEGKRIAFAENLACKFEIFFFFVHFDIAATGNTARTHTTRNNRCVRSHTATNGKNTFRIFHTFDIFR